MKKNQKVKQKLPIGYIGFNDEKTTKQKKTDNSAKITTSGREYDANCPITVLNNKKDSLSLIKELKLG